MVKWRKALAFLALKPVFIHHSIGFSSKNNALGLLESKTTDSLHARGRL
jgi:hypothetical protein